MGNTRRKCTNFFLSLTIVALGIISTVLLYNAGQKTIDLFWGPSNTYKDELGRINRRVVTDEWYGLLVLRGWAFGFLYVVPGLTGIVSALFYNRVTMIIHFVVAILVLVPGSVLHSVGGVGLVMYRLLVVEGASRYDPWLGDCIYVSDTAIPYTYQDAQCLLGRKVLNLAIAAVAVLLVSWIFVFSHVLYCAFTFYNVTRKANQRKMSSNTSVKYQYLEAPTSNVDTQGASGDTDRASGTQQGQSHTRPRRRVKKVDPPVSPSLTQTATVESQQEAGPCTDGAPGEQDDGNLLTPGQPVETQLPASSTTLETGACTGGTSLEQDDGNHPTYGLPAHTEETPVAAAGEDIQLQNVTEEKAQAQAKEDKDPLNNQATYTNPAYL